MILKVRFIFANDESHMRMVWRTFCEISYSRLPHIFCRVYRVLPLELWWLWNSCRIFCWKSRSMLFSLLTWPKVYQVPPPWPWQGHQDTNQPTMDTFVTWPLDRVGLALAEWAQAWVFYVWVLDPLKDRSKQNKDHWGSRYISHMPISVGFMVFVPFWLLCIHNLQTTGYHEKSGA